MLKKFWTTTTKITQKNDRLIQGAKKVTFTACHSGKLKLTFTSPNIISTSPKNVLMSRLISQFLCDLDSSKNFTCPSGKLITEFTSPIAKPTSPGLSDTTLFARWIDSTFLWAFTECSLLHHLLLKEFTFPGYIVRKVEIQWRIQGRAPGSAAQAPVQPLKHQSKN